MSGLTLDQMRDMIVRDFSRHWELNDPGHRIGHFSEVETCATYINEKLGLGEDPQLIMLVSYFHDLFSWSRKNHHELSHQFVLSTDYPLIAELPRDAIIEVAYACLSHRASYKGAFLSQFAELMSAADRGFPETDVERLLVRPIRYRLNQGLSEEASREGAIAHLKEKYSASGYARYPGLYLRAFGSELEKQQKVIDSL